MAFTRGCPAPRKRFRAKTARNPNRYSSILRRKLRKKGLEPSRTYIHMNLNHACLPIPALPQARIIVSLFPLSVNS